MAAHNGTPRCGYMGGAGAAGCVCACVCMHAASGDTGCVVLRASGLFGEDKA